MNLKKLLIAAVAGVFIVPAMASAYSSTGAEYSSATETLVEGHTVFAMIQATICIDNYGDMGNDENGDGVADDPYDNEEKVDCPSGDNFPGDFDVSWDVRANVTVQRLGTAVAVLVRDRVKEYIQPPGGAPKCQTNRDVVATVLYENPGVLWFNDQFLVGDDLDIVETKVDANVDVCQKDSKILFDESGLDWRYPCGGWILATQSGNPDPRDLMSAWTYTESYQIIDPNDNTWVVDKYSLLPAAATVTVAPTDVMQDLGLDDDQNPSNPGTEFDNDDAADGDLRAVIDDSGADPSATQNTLGFHLGRVNMWSVPVMMLDVVDPGPTSGCSYTPYDDLRGGDVTNRMYNGVLFFFFEDLVMSGAKVHGEGAPDDGDVSGCEAGADSAPYNTCPGGDDDNEGNSHPYNANEPDSGPAHVHPTAEADLYFSNVQPPTPVSRSFAVFDTVGSGAPMHTHSGEAFDDRVSYSVCGDVDQHRYKDDQVFNGGGTYTGTSTYSSEENFRGGTHSDDPAATEGEGEAFPGDGANTDDCTGGYDGGTTGWDPSGDGEDGDVPSSEYY